MTGSNRPTRSAWTAANRSSLDELLAVSDFITLHLPLTPETKNMLNAETFAKMKDGVYIINASRGGIIDEDALLAALDSGKVAGAALDVFAAEPPGPTPLVGHPKVICTPHIGAQTLEAQARAGYDISTEIVAALQRRNPALESGLNVLQQLIEDIRMDEKLNQLKALLAEIDDLYRTQAVLGWDQQTYMPSGGAEDRGNQLTTLARLEHERWISDEMGSLLEALSAASLAADSDDAALLRVTRRQHEKRTRVPARWVEEFTQATTLGQEEWVRARKASDFSLFRPAPAAQHRTAPRVRRLSSPLTSTFTIRCWMISSRG